MRQLTGLDQFKLLLSEFRNLSLWAAGGSVVLPFIASFISVIPPWPSGLNIMTAIFQLVSLMFVYQSYFGASRRTITKNMGLLSISAFVIILVYMMIFTIFTIYVPQAHRSMVIGYACTDDAFKVFGSKCPLLDLNALASVAYDEFMLWTKPLQS
jgi:hypothetical protein